MLHINIQRFRIFQMDTEDYISLILYYGRTHFYHSMQKTALDGLTKYPTQTVFRLFNGIALALGNRMQEGVRELSPIKNDVNFGLAAILALIFAHKHCTVIDKDALSVLEQRLKDESSTKNANANYYAAVFLYMTGKTEKARLFADKTLKLENLHEPAVALKAWTELTDSAAVSGNVLHAFEQVLANNRKNIDASLGEVRFFQFRGQFDNAINVLNKLSIRFPELNIPLIEKMETHLAAFDWDLAFETALRILNLEPTNVPALRVKALLLIGRESNFKSGAATLQQLLAAAERVEMGNYNLILQICQLFSRICSRNKEILVITIHYMDKIMQLNKGNIECISELGYQQLMINNIREATVCFRSAIKMNDNYFYALCGLTLCQLQQNGVTEQAQQQIEFLNELDGIEREPHLILLKAAIATQEESSIALLIDATEAHMKRIKTLVFGIEYVRLLNPDFMLQLTTAFLKHSPVQLSVKVGVNVTQDTVHISLKHCISILEMIIRVCPGHRKALFMRAKVQFVCGEITSAASTLHRILNDFDDTYTDAHLLLSQIQMQQQLFSKAAHTLEMALSHNFAVRENPMYHLLMGIIQRHNKQIIEARKSFHSAMHLVGCSFLLGDQLYDKDKIPNTSSGNIMLESFSLADKATLYLELICTLREMNDMKSITESERLLQYAMEEFSNTPEEGRLVIAHAELMLKNSNVAKAISLLAAIQPKQSYYIQAKTHLANIYLQYKKDRVAFAKCFKALVDARPESESYLMLGGAYMSIQEPDLAVEAYQKALNMNPNDSLLASKLGRAYVKAHQYARAIKYYQEAIKNPDHLALKLDLAELHLKMKQYQNAAAILSQDAVKAKIEEHDIVALQMRTKEFLLLARIHEKSGNTVLSLQTLKDARDNQYRVQKRVSVLSGNLYEPYKTLSKICFLLAQQSVKIREYEQALKFFKESLKYIPNDMEILSCLARLYMQRNSMELCRDACKQILQIDSNNEAASVMMADLSFRKMEFENAAYHFSQLLISQPCYWTALARLIEVMRRSGNLTEVIPFLQRAEQATLSPAQTPGLNYCKGLFEWYSGNPNGALRNFNTARRDYEWGQQAIFNMIEICINPDGDILSSNDVQEFADGSEFSESRMIALRTAERLLKELHPRPGGLENEALNHRLLHNFLQLASREKFQIESALQDFTDLASREEYQNSVGPVLGISSALVLLKQTQRAKNHLKRFMRTSWKFEEAEYLERSWLLLADIYIHASKLDVAESLVDRVLEHNKSCTKAYEMAGYIAEKSQLHRDAAKNYNFAWNYGGRSKPNVGYKLAFNYMKTKRYADAINVCQQVIKLHPDYMIIRKDILDKCRTNLRP